MYQRKIVCYFCQQSNNAKIIDCERYAFFKCVKYDNVRQSYLFNWYVHGTELYDFYALLSSQHPEIVKYVFMHIYHGFSFHQFIMNAVNGI